MKQYSGYTILELMIALGIVALLAVITVPLYQGYIREAEITAISLEYEIWAEKVESSSLNQVISKCADLLTDTDAGLIAEHGARVSMGFKAVSGGPLQGYRPIFQVCARTDEHRTRGIEVAKAAHKAFSNSAYIEPGAVVSDTVVSFSLRLTANDNPVCRVPVGSAFTPCGLPVATPDKPVTVVQAPAMATAVPVVAPVAQTIKVPALLARMDETVDTDFADPPITGTWQRTDPTVWGWKTDNPDGTVEHGSGVAYGDTSGGNVGIIELEGSPGEPSNIYRQIATQPGAAYTFSFELSGRVGVTSQSAGVEIVWDGQVIETLFPAGDTFGFVHHEYQLTATGPSSRIELRAVTRDGTGPVVDNLKMEYTGGGAP
ncbi:MAG: hypothetical protein ACI9B8_003796 [Sulfitobacter sp.]|jgi:hypothetical protein